MTVHLLGKDSFQEIDITGVTMPITKHNFIVKDVNSLADTMRRAFHIAQDRTSGPGAGGYYQGCDGSIAANIQPKKPEPIERSTDTSQEEDVDAGAGDDPRAANALCIIVGGGAVISDASEELREFAEKIQAPVCRYPDGKGRF